MRGIARTMDDGTFITDLNQIRAGQMSLIKQVERLRRKRKGDSANLKKIQDDALRTLNEIDEIRKRVEDSETSELNI